MRRLDFVPQAQEQSELHHYLQFNFKVTVIGEEKQEDLASVTMDVQAGHAVLDPAHLRQLAVYETEPAFAGFPLAQPRWHGTAAPLAVETFHALLARGVTAMHTSYAARLAGVSARMHHHLQLDLARIEEYYDELARDLQRRKNRLDAADTARSQEMDAKLAMLENERRIKTADVRGRYGLRVELELVNTLLITQPKISVPASISNRTAAIQRTLVWDPLVHRLAPLVCDVCGEPGDGLQLCTGGHLAHSHCLAPQCVDCKRVYCQFCAGQIGACVVCARPVCRPSQIKCPTCGRITCHEHQRLCHADAGQPAVLAPATPPSIPPPAQPAQPAAKPPAKTPPPPATRREKPKPPPAKAAPAKPQPAAPVVTGVRIDVQIYEDKPVIAAFVMRSTKRVLATRVIELTDQGIYVSCQCEKSPCPADGYYYRPASAAQIAAQIGDLLQKLREEYLVPAKKTHYLIMRGQAVTEGRIPRLAAIWRDPQRLAEAVQGFERL